MHNVLEVRATWDALDVAVAIEVTSTAPRKKKKKKRENKAHMIHVTYNYGTASTQHSSESKTL